MSVVIVISLNHCIVATGNTGWQRSTNQTSLQGKPSRPVVLIRVVVVIVIAGKEVDVSIVVKIRKNRSLDKNVAVRQFRGGVGLPASSCLEEIRSP